MKKTVYALLILLWTGTAAVAQDFSYSYGIKGGINYSLGGYLEQNADNLPDDMESQQFDAQSKIGFHGGAFVQANLGKLFLRPEIVYTSIKTGYELPNATTEHSVTKIDIPLLLGYNVFSKLDLYAGPVYSNINKSEIEVNPNGETFPVVVQETPGVNLHIGAKWEFRRFGIDLRYERTLSTAENLITYPGFDPINTEEGPTDYYGVEQLTFADPRIHQIILSITFKIGGSDIGGGGSRRGGDWCY